MTTRMSVRDLTRSGSALFDYDYIDIEDKKANEYKGVFIPRQFADDVKAFLNTKLSQERKANVDAIMKFSGILNGETSNSSIQELKATAQ
ncbi:MAG: hypothetical protein PHQ22_08380 [Sulfuricurvum sp.]|nr:hypothetical protein [Sulfuricurvum sp.]MDD5387193.1 hypothetical protein [Sulfuricurvum sp.]